MGVQAEADGARGRWLALTAALLGWMFDGAEMGVFSMVGRPAVKDLLATTDEGLIGLWFGIIIAGFLVGAATGGVLFGWLGDRIGRVRAMTLSVATYAIFTGVCGLVTATWQLGVLRFIAALGMGGEWSLGVALVMEVWPNRSRAFMAGLIGAAANVGYLLVGLIGFGLAAMSATLTSLANGLGLDPALVVDARGNGSWRLLMVLGATPALLTFFIRLFVPESERWKAEEGRGTTSSWATRDLLGVCVGVLGPVLIIYLLAGDALVQRELGWSLLGPMPQQLRVSIQIAGTLVGVALVTVGYLYPVLRYLQRQPDVGRGAIPRMLLAACLSAVALLGTWGSTQWAPAWADQLTHQQAGAKEYTQIWLAIGAIVGTILAALMGDWFGRRPAYVLLCVTALASVFFLFLCNTAFNMQFLTATFVAGVCTASFYGWLPLYLPELFRTSVRATGQGFGFNFGRILAAVGVLQTGNLMSLFKEPISVGGFEVPGGYPLACSAMSLVYLLGIGLIWLAPETRGKPLPD